MFSNIILSTKMFVLLSIFNKNINFSCLCFKQYLDQRLLSAILVLTWYYKLIFYASFQLVNWVQCFIIVNLPTKLKKLPLYIYIASNFLNFVAGLRHCLICSRSSYEPTHWNCMPSHQKTERRDKDILNNLNLVANNII